MSEAFFAAAALTFAGSVHCVGMCGGFALAVAAGSRGVWQVLFGQLLMQLGKATTYAFLGALSGALGRALAENASYALAGRALTLLAALALALAGLSLLGLLPSRTGGGGLTATLAPAWSSVIGPLLERKPAGYPLLVGLLMGALPCGLVYAGLAVAAASGDPAVGAATLAGVALGTVPALAAVALAGGALSFGARRGLARVAGLLLLAAAAVTATRGLGGSHRHAHGVPAPGAAASTPTAEVPSADGAASASPAEMDHSQHH